MGLRLLPVAKIAALIGTLPPDRGISSYFENLTSTLKRMAQIEVAVFRRPYPGKLYTGSLEDKDRTLGSTGSEILKISPINPLNWLRAIARIESPIIHLNWWSPFLAPAVLCLLVLWRLRGRISVITVHNLEFHEFPWLGRSSLWFAVNLAHATVVHHESAAAQLHVGPRGVIRLIRPGLLGRPRSSRQEARARLGIDEREIVFLFFGNIRPYKGLDVLLRAWAKVPETSGFHLVIAGDCWEDWDAKYAPLVSESRARITVLLGYHPRDKVDELFASTDVVVLPYLRFSSQSGVGMLALRYGLPIVATRVGGLPELIVDEMFLCEAGEVKELGRILSHIMSDGKLLERLRKRVPKVSRRFDRRLAAESHIHLYEEVLSENAPRRSAYTRS